MLQVADSQPRAPLLSSTLHHFIHLETALLDAQALVTFNSNALSRSPPSPSPNPNTPLPHRINFHAEKNHTRGPLKLRALRPSSAGGGEGSRVPRGGLLPPGSVPSPATDTYPGRSGGRPSRGGSGTGPLHGHSGHRSGSRRLAGTPVHKIHQDRLRKTKVKSPQNARAERGKSPSLSVAFSADATPHQCASRLSAALPRQGSRIIESSNGWKGPLGITQSNPQYGLPVHYGRSGRGTRLGCSRRARAPGFCPPSARWCGSQNPAPLGEAAPTPCVPRVSTPGQLRIYSFFTFCQSFFSFFPPRPFPIRTKPRDLAAGSHAVFPITIPRDSLCGTAKSQKERGPRCKEPVGAAAALGPRAKELTVLAEGSSPAGAAGTGPADVVAGSPVVTLTPVPAAQPKPSFRAL